MSDEGIVTDITENKEGTFPVQYIIKLIKRESVLVVVEGINHQVNYQTGQNFNGCIMKIF